MTFEQLLYAEVLSHHYSMQKAADILHISKSGLSLAIAQLEDELGIKMFERTSKGTTLTSEGLQTLSAITDVLCAKNALMNTVSMLSNSLVHEKVTLRYMNTMLRPFINSYLGDYQKEYPHVMLDMCCSNRNTIIEKLRNNEIDAGFIAMPILLSDLGEEITFEPVCYTKIVLACSSDNPMLKKEVITLDDLKEQKFCLFNDESYDYVFDQLQYMCGSLSLVFRTDDILAMSEAIHRLNAVCFVRVAQKQLFKENIFKDMNYISIGHLIDDHSTLAWVTNTHYPLSKPAKRLMSMITEQIKTDTTERVSVID